MIKSSWVTDKSRAYNESCKESRKIYKDTRYKTWLINGIHTYPYPYVDKMLAYGSDDSVNNHVPYKAKKLLKDAYKNPSDYEIHSIVTEEGGKEVVSIVLAKKEWLEGYCGRNPKNLLVGGIPA